MKKDNYFRYKDLRKTIRSICQIIILIGIAFLIINATFNLKKYDNHTKAALDGDKGFITLSYFGVDQNGDDTLISTQRLNAHLKALHDLGYVTISQQDVQDYYAYGKELPEKSLFLIFEDGRRDTAIFAQEILEKYNFKATMLTYADKFAKNDPKFLTSKDLIHLENSTFWELGTNGYRLEYINVFDRYNHYLGQLNTLEFAGVANYLGRNYNHYLMDYIRDEYGLPMESYDEMSARINGDYDKMAEIYQNEISQMPTLYILMHSNTGKFATNDKVSVINEERIKDLFKINFNREGNAYNNRDSSIYDLTRLQPQSYWSTNHLLMKIQDDTKQNVSFVSGDTDRKSKWDTLKGESEFKDEAIILTSLPENTGLMQLKNSEVLKNFDLSVKMKGNLVGVQKIDMRASADLSSALSVEISNNQLLVKEKRAGDETTLATIDLKKLDGTQSQSVAEDEKNAEIEELKTEIQYATSIEEATALTNQLNQKLQESANSVADGSPVYDPTIDIRKSGSRALEISLFEDTLSVKVDNKLAVDQLKVDDTTEGSVFLESAWGGYGYSQRNLSDDVYDGIFEKLTINENSSIFGEEKGKLIYDDCYHGMALVLYKIETTWQSVVNWFVKTL